MDTCRHQSRPAVKTIQLYWRCQVLVCDECYARFEKIRTAVDTNTGSILRLSTSGRYRDALEEVHHLFDANRSLDDFGWLRRQVLMIEATIHEDANEHALAVEKLREIKQFGSPNPSAFVQDEIALARGLEKLGRDEDALYELEEALGASSAPQDDLPSPLDIQAALVHYVRISQHLGRDIPDKYRGLVVRAMENLQVPRDLWEKELSLSSMVLRAEEWLDRQSRLAIAGTKDPLCRPPNNSE